MFAASDCDGKRRSMLITRKRVPDVVRCGGSGRLGGRWGPEDAEGIGMEKGLLPEEIGSLLLGLCSGNLRNASKARSHFGGRVVAAEELEGCGARRSELRVVK